MNIQKRTILFLSLLLTLIIIEMIHVNYVERKRNRAAVEVQFQERVDFIDKTIRNQSEKLETFVHFLSRHPDINRDIRGKKTESLRRLIEPFWVNTGVDAVWIVRRDTGLVLFQTNIDHPALHPRLIQTEKMGDSLLKGNLSRFFRRGGTDLLEIQTAPVWALPGPGKIPIPEGFVAVCRVWNQPFLTDLASITGSEKTELFFMPQPLPKMSEARRVYQKYLSDRDRKTIAVLRFDLDFPVSRTLASSKQRIILLLILFSIGGIALFVFFVLNFIVPLRRLAKSLDQGDQELIIGMMQEKNEFGHLSRLIHNFFKQKADLLQEIRDRQRMEQKLKAKEEKYRNLIENQGEGVVVLDSNEYFLFSNPAAEKMFGVFPERLIGYNLSEFIAKDQLRIVQQQTRLRSMGRKTAFEIQITRADGEKRWIFVNATPQFEPDNSLNSFEIFVDITDRKSAEMALQESEVKFRSLAESINAGIFILQADHFRYVNSFFESLTAHTRRELMKMVYLDIIHPESREIVHEYVERMWQIPDRSLTPVERREIRLIDREGQEAWVDFSLTRIDLPREKALLGTIHDITERKRMEAEMIRSQKLESVAQLAGGIAHDFNNYLTAIMGNLSLARMRCESNVELEKIIGKAENATIRARDLSQQLLTFSRGGDPIKRVIQISSLIQETVEFVLSGSRVKARLFLEAELWTIDADESQISQVFNNLIINAVDAMPQGGFIDIQAENKSQAELERSGEIPTDTFIADGGTGKTVGFIRITFSDHGIGILPDALPKIFDPYFSTKKNGAGLGLSVVYSIIRKHGGAITVESKPEQGTTFRIWFPASDAVNDAQQKKEDRIIRGKGRILVMDDEEFILEIASEMLQFLGYETEICRDGDEAVTQYRGALQENRPYSAILMDLTIPGGLGGKEAILRLLEIDPNVRVIVSSGYSNDPVLADFRQYGFRGIVAKPYRIETLSEVLHTVIQEL